MNNVQGSSQVKALPAAWGRVRIGIEWGDPFGPPGPSAVAYCADLVFCLLLIFVWVLFFIKFSSHFSCTRKFMHIFYIKFDFKSQVPEFGIASDIKRFCQLGENSGKKSSYFLCYLKWFLCAEVIDAVYLFYFSNK